MIDAIALYDRIISLNPDIPEIHNNRGLALVGLQKFVEAEAAYRRAIALNADNPRLSATWGFCFVSYANWRKQRKICGTQSP